MLLVQTLLFIILAAVSGAHLAACIKDNVTGIRISKPFLVPIIIAIYLVSASIVNALIVIALILGLGGDILLMFRKTSQKALLSGLLSFLTGQVVYIIAFITAPGYFSMEWWLVLLILPYLLVGVALHRSLKNDLGTMKVPAMVYMGVILLMGAFSMLRAFSAPTLSFWLVLAGSTSFILSDAILAFEQFKKITLLNHAVVMITYISAQLLIALGFAVLA